ncbi:HAMP domain-containing sensor histidine kinase [Nocardia transvalensis]|uniref:HAMP domain-containing sensor histidine kinase n=1 Tax=Nocardia transvalensis TaxID=37333 RepID=UPI0018941160|nr:HAMP domain-containing sensor histidine kinase [Nocardia transvalensis]MBF6329751.1 HAMP domain-containing histidine kinase [Nocardia transvalensis]
MRRPLSLRARVAVAGAATAALVVVAMSAVFFALAPSGTEQQVDSTVRALRITRAASGEADPARSPTAPTPPASLGVGGASAPGGPGVPSPGEAAAPGGPVLGTQGAHGAGAPGSGAGVSGPRIFLSDGGPGSGPPEPFLSWDLPAKIGKGDTMLVAAAVPKQAVADTVAAQRNRIVAVGAGAIVVAAALGWLFAHRAVLPLRRLTTATKGVGTRLSLEVPPTKGTTETAELTAAMNQMLERIADERRHTADALAAARDFAATSAHELRTPLTSMRTDLQVLRTMEVSERERLDILDDVLTTQQSVEDTLAALERLALGELTTEDDFDEVDLDELIDQVVEDAGGNHPEVTVTSTVAEPLPIQGLAAGLRSILDNAVTNSVRHGRATRVDVAARRIDGDMVELTVDDNGSGVPPGDRERVFERFARGATGAAGSGLGLALVAQQARLHGGAVRLDDSPLGGARLRVTLRAHPDRPAAETSTALDTSRRF